MLRIEILVKRIKRIQCEDCRCNIGNTAGFCKILSGVVNWTAILTQLKGLTYNDWVAATMTPPAPC